MPVTYLFTRNITEQAGIELHSSESWNCRMRQEWRGLVQFHDNHVIRAGAEFGEKSLPKYYYEFLVANLHNRAFIRRAAQSSSARDVTASFKKVSWKWTMLMWQRKGIGITNPMLLALNYIEKKPFLAPKALLRTANQLQKRDDIVVTKPDKGDGVVITDKIQLHMPLQRSLEQWQHKVHSS